MSEDSRIDWDAKIRQMNAIGEGFKTKIAPNVLALLETLEGLKAKITPDALAGMERYAELSRAHWHTRPTDLPKPAAPAWPALASPRKPAPEPAHVLHSTKAPRRNTLKPVIELAQERCRNPSDAAEVWAVLLVLAEEKEPPLLEATEEGLKYLKGGGVGFFTRDALQKRLKRPADKRR